MSELLYRVALTKIPKVGGVTARNLVSHCGSAEAVFRASKAELTKIPNIGEAIAQHILTQDVLRWAEKEMDFIEKNDVKVLFDTDKTFPQRLRATHDCPFQLFYKGTADLNHGRIVGIVGTRKPTAYGLRFCETFVEKLLPYNALIISGLAYGIDVAAHRKSIEMGIETIGVMGTGLQRIYPSEHREIAQRMVLNGGLLTEYPSDQDAEREHFPMRNRIIAGMCDALLVVETATKGGSMITANTAFDYNKEIFALPGRISDPMSAGCHKLIKNQKAQLIESADDFINAMMWDQLDKRRFIQPRLFVELNENQRIVLKIIENTEGGALIDSISHKSQFTPGNIANILLELEMQGLIKTLPGKKYVVV
ncbi:MAG: DNA-protecting protein DprA [Saprospiraceae bacterium]|nr:DNA-protecting protein DprA [Saprospiraceae bacterium]